MFERFTTSARAIVLRAKEVARDASADAVRTEHLLHALLDAEDPLVEDAFGPGALDRAGADRSHLPFDRSGKKVFELTLREALHLRHRALGPEHILLGCSTATPARPTTCSSTTAPTSRRPARRWCGWPPLADAG